MLIGFLPNKESAREMQANLLQHYYYCLCRRASTEAANRQAEMSIRYSLETSSSTKETSYPSPATQLEVPTVTKTWLVNRALKEDAPDHIESGGSQVGSEESDCGTARWIGNQLQQNWP